MAYYAVKIPRLKMVAIIFLEITRIKTSWKRVARLLEGSGFDHRVKAANGFHPMFPTELKAQMFIALPRVAREINTDSK